MSSHARAPDSGDKGGGDENDGDKRGQEITVAGTDVSERPAKKPRRGNYISRAWYVKPSHHLAVRRASPLMDLDSTVSLASRGR